ncbi:MAG: phosphatidate cytidylyltransferase [Christensenellaceae bacterium]
MLKRILVSIPIIMIIALALFLQSWVMVLLVVALALFSQFELVRAMSTNGKPIIKSVSYVFAAMSAVVFLLAYYNRTIAQNMPVYMIMLFVILCIAAFIIAIFSKEYSADSVMHTIFTFIYPQLFFVMFYLLIIGNIANYGQMFAMFAMVFIPALLSDTLAYFFGKSFGKKKLCPTISPKKTIVGSVAGIAGGVIGALIVCLIVYLLGYTVGNIIIYAMVGALLAAISQIGDLSASFIKRALDIKDFGKLLPGHGGILDRIDSVIFCIPIVFILAFLHIL